MKIRWLITAVEDVNTICNYLATKSPAAADKLYDTFVNAVDELLIFPEAGPIEPLLTDFTECFRYLVVSKHYKLIYTINETCIEIIAVWDCRRNPSQLVQEVNK